MVQTHQNQLDVTTFDCKNEMNKSFLILFTIA